MSILSKLLAEADDGSKEIDGMAENHADHDGEELDEELALKRMATSLNILSEDLDAESLSEAMSIVRLNKEAKTAAMATRTAILMAKSKGDVLYEKYAKFNGLRLQLRTQILKKYGAKANQRARALIAGTSVKPLGR